MALSSSPSMSGKVSSQLSKAPSGPLMTWEILANAWALRRVALLARRASTAR